MNELPNVTSKVLALKTRVLTKVAFLAIRVSFLISYIDLIDPEALQMSKASCYYNENTYCLFPIHF